jgi:hypothetical protein
VATGSPEPSVAEVTDDESDDEEPSDTNQPLRRRQRGAGRVICQPK